MNDDKRIWIGDFELTVESYEDQPDGSTIIICTNGTRLRLLPGEDVDLPKLEK